MKLIALAGIPTKIEPLNQHRQSGPVGIGEVDILKLDGRREAEIHVNMGDGELALGFLADVVLQWLAQPVPVEEQQKNQPRNNNNAEQDGLLAPQPGFCDGCRACLRHGLLIVWDNHGI